MSPGNNGDQAIEPADTMPASVITPQSGPLVFGMTGDSSQKPVYVAEVPECRFEGLPICLSTGKVEDIPRVKAMVMKFRQLWHDIAANGGLKRV